MPRTGDKIMIRWDFCDLGEKTLCLKTVEGSSKEKYLNICKKSGLKAHLMEIPTLTHMNLTEMVSFDWLAGWWVKLLKITLFGPQLGLEPETPRLPEEGK